MTRKTLASRVMLVSFLLFTWMRADGQTHKSADKGKPAPNYSGMYSFLREGEFVQITVEEKGKLTGFVSRFGNTESDRGVFLDHFFKAGQLDGDTLTFTTETVHGLSYEFRGAVERGEGKNPGDEAYYVLKGTLTEITMDDSKRTASHSREVALKAFPEDLAPPRPDKK